MSLNYTSNQAYPYPDVDETLNNVNDWLYYLAVHTEERGVQRFATQAELASKRPTPTAGEFAWVTADSVLQVYDGSSWERVYPPQPAIYTGTATPSSSLGSPGDIYVKSI